jgi:hypothetical protein
MTIAFTSRSDGGDGMAANLVNLAWGYMDG